MLKKNCVTISVLVMKMEKNIISIYQKILLRDMLIYY